MIELGLVKAKRKDGEGWVEGYLFKHDKFNDGKDVIFSVLRSGQNGVGEFMERPVEGYQVHEETICFNTTAKNLYNKNVYQNDTIKMGMGNVGVVAWDEEALRFIVKTDTENFPLSCCASSETIGNLYDEYNFSKKEKKALKKAKAVKGET